MAKFSRLHPMVERAVKFENGYMGQNLTTVNFGDNYEFFVKVKNMTK